MLKSRKSYKTTVSVELTLFVGNSKVIDHNILDGIFIKTRSSAERLKHAKRIN